MKKVSLQHTLIHTSETAERRVDIAEFADWAVACGLDPLEAFADYLRRKRS